MSKKIIFSIAGLLVLLLAACGGNGTNSNTDDSSTGGTDTNGAATEDALKISVANITQPVHSWNQSLEVFEDYLIEQTGGNFEMELFPGGQLGNEADMLQQLDQGNIDMMVITTAQLSEVSEAFAGWLMPYIVDTHEQAYELWMSEESMGLFDTLSTYNVKGLGYLSSGFRYYLMRDHGIETPEDLNNKSLRITPSPAKVDYYRLLNVSPTPMPLTEVYSSLQQGVIDGVDIDSESIIPQKLFEAGKHLTASNHLYWAGAILVNSSFWDSLSHEEQELIQSAVNKSMEFNVEYLNTSEKNNLETLSNEPDMQLYEIDRGAFQPYVEETHQKWSEKNPEIKRFLEKANEIVGR